jgi:hypothetical protein
VREEVAHQKGAIAMLYALAVILLIAWLHGFVGIYSIGAFVHLLWATFWDVKASRAKLMAPARFE